MLFEIRRPSLSFEHALHPVGEHSTKDKNRNALTVDNKSHEGIWVAFGLGDNSDDRHDLSQLLFLIFPMPVLCLDEERLLVNSF